MAAIQQHDQQRKLVHKQFNSPMGLYSDQNVKETLDREIKAFGGAGIELDNQIMGKPSNLQNSAVLKMLEEEESERYTGKRKPITTTTEQRQSRPRQRCIIDRDTVLKINRRQPKRDYSWPPPDSIYSRSRSSSEEQFNEDIRHKHKIDHIKEMFDKGIIFQHKNISTINKINCTKNSETLINLNQNNNNNNNNNKSNSRSRSLNDNFRGNNNAKHNNELLSNYNLAETDRNLKKDNFNTESFVRKIFYLPENELYIGMVDPTRKYFENLSKNSVYSSPIELPNTNNQLSLSSDADGLLFEKKWKSTENFIDFHHSEYQNQNIETRTKHDSSQQIFNSTPVILKSDKNNSLKAKNIFTPAIRTDTNRTNTTSLRTLSLDRQRQRQKYNNSNSFNELPPLKPRGEYRKNLASSNKTKLNLNNTQNNNNIMEIMENSIINKTTTTTMVKENLNKKFIENCNQKSTQFDNIGQSNLNYIEPKENFENLDNYNLTLTNYPTNNTKKSAIKLKISTNSNLNNENPINISDEITKTNNNFKSSPIQITTENIIKSNNKKNKISYTTEPPTKGKTLLNFHEKFQPSDNITKNNNINNNSISTSSSTSSRNTSGSSQNDENKIIKFPKKNLNGMQKKNIIICNISDADESTKTTAPTTTTTIQNENINNKNDNKIQQIRKNIIFVPKITKIPSTTTITTQKLDSKISDGLVLDDGQNNYYCCPLDVNNNFDDDCQPNEITNFSCDNKIILVQGSQYKNNYNLTDGQNTKIISTNTASVDDDYHVGNIKNIRNNNYTISSSSLPLVPTMKTNEYENQIITNSLSGYDNFHNNNKLIKQNLTQKNIENLSINLNENLKKKSIIPDDNTEMIITSDGNNRIVNIINLNQNKDLQNSNNKLYNQSTTSLSSLLTSPMYSSKDFSNDDKKPYREINVVKKKFCDSITQDDNKKNFIKNIENDENLRNIFLNEQENITLVVKGKNNKEIKYDENGKNDDKKKYSCLETNNIDNTKPPDKAINISTTKTNTDDIKTTTTNTIVPTPTITKIYYKQTNDCLPSSISIDKNLYKRHGIYYTDGIDICQENNKILSYDSKTINENDYKQVHRIDDKLIDLLQIDNNEKIILNNNDNEFKMNNKIDGNDKKNLILLPIENNINDKIDIYNQDKLPIRKTTSNIDSDLQMKYSNIQKSISEDLRRIDHYMASAEKSLYNIETKSLFQPEITDNIFIFETPLKKVMKHFIYNNNYKPVSILNNNDPYQLLTNQTENMPVVENVLTDLSSFVLDNLNKTTTNNDNIIIPTNFQNNDSKNQAHIIDINDNYDIEEPSQTEDQSKDDTNSIFDYTTCTETLSTNSEPTIIDKIIQSKNILSGYLIIKQNQEELLDKATNQLHEENPLIEYNRNDLHYNENFQHHNHNLTNTIKSISPSCLITNIQQENIEKQKHHNENDDENTENLNGDIINSLKFNDDKKFISSNNESNTNTTNNDILKISNFEMNDEKDGEDNNIKDNNKGQQNHYKIMSNKIADNVKFKIDKSLNFEYYDDADDDVNKQIYHHHNQYIHKNHQNSNNECTKLTTTQSVGDDVINKDATILHYSHKTMKRSSPKSKVKIYIENHDDEKKDDNDNNQIHVNDNKSDQIVYTNKTPNNNDEDKNFEIIPDDLILTTSNQIELSSLATVELAKTIKFIEINELTPSPTLSTYDNNNSTYEKCDNTNNAMMMMMMPEIIFDKQQQKIEHNHETKYSNFIDNNVIADGNDDDVDGDNDFYRQKSGENITNITTTGITNKNNCGIMNNLLKDIVDKGQCGMMKNSINGEYARVNDGYINRNIINSEHYYLSNNSEQDNKLSNEIFNDDNNKKYFNNNDYLTGPTNNIALDTNVSENSSIINRERSRSRVRFIEPMTDDEKPKFHLRCTSQPPPIKHLIKISKDYINYNSRNYDNLIRQHSYDSNINNCDNYQYLMSSPTLQFYPLDGQYEWTNEGYKRVAWPPADQARTYRAYTPQPTNQQPNQDNNSYQSQPTQSLYPQQPYSGGQSYDPQHQQQQQPQHHQPEQHQQSYPQSQNPSYQPANQGYQKPNYPGANQPSSQQGNQPQQSHPQQGYQPQQSHPQQGHQPQQSHPQQGHQPQQSHLQQGHQPQQSHPQQGYQPQQSHPQQGYKPQQSHPQQDYHPQQSHPQQGYQPQQSHPQQGYQPQQSHPQQQSPQQGYQSQKSQPDQGYVHPLNKQPSSQQGYVHPVNQSQPHSPQPQQQPTSKPYQQSGYIPYPHQDNNNPSLYQTPSAPSHMNGPGSTVSFTGGVGVAQRPTQSAGLPQYNPQPKPFQSQYNVPQPSAQSYQQQQQQPVQTGDEQRSGWTHVASPAPVRSGYTQPGYQPNTTGGVQAAPKYGSDSQFGSNQNISSQQEPTNQAYNQSVPVSHNQPSFGQQQFYQQPLQQQQNQMHPAQNQYHQPSSYESQNNQYNQQQPQQQYNSQAEQTNPGVITLRRETPTHQPPAAVIVSQPATKSFRGGSLMRGDLKWPPQDCRDRMAADAEMEQQLSLGPACRPTKQQKDYSGFFAKHALSHNYPGYKIPPGTQHIEASF